MSITINETTPFLNDDMSFDSPKTSILYYTAQIGALIVTIQSLYTIWKDGYTFFNWHPTLALLFFYFITQSILTLQSAKNRTDLAEKVKLYNKFQSLAFISLTGAFLVIFIHLKNNDHQHFSSTHAKLGLTIFIFLVLGAAVGYTTLHYPQLYGSPAIARKVTPFHQLASYITYIIIAANILLGLEFAFKLHDRASSYWVYPSLILVVASILIMADSKKLP